MAGVENLALADEMESLCPKILPNSDAPHIFTDCGQGATQGSCIIVGDMQRWLGYLVVVMY